MSQRDIANSRSIVTGASSGIGRALVHELARQGGHVVAVARREALLVSLAEEIATDAACTGKIEIVVGDITEPTTRHAAIDRAASAFGGLDFLINNAGVGSFGRFADNDPALLRAVMEVNFFAAAELIREAIPALESGRRPMIVNISSILGHRGIPRMSEYSASKFALQGFSQALRVELSRLGIGLLVVSPGTTETDFYERVIHGRGDAPWSTGYGVKSEDVAKKTLRAMCRGRREIMPNVVGRLLIWANKRMPAAVDRILKKYA